MATLLAYSEEQEMRITTMLKKASCHFERALAGEEPETDILDMLAEDEWSPRVLRSLFDRSSKSKRGVLLLHAPKNPSFRAF